VTDIVERLRRVTRDDLDFTAVVEGGIHAERGDLLVEAAEEILRLRRLLFEVLGTGDVLAHLAETSSKADSAIAAWHELALPVYRDEMRSIMGNSYD
jgi:hypothetical protein